MALRAARFAWFTRCVDFRILGPIRVSHNGEPVRLAGVKQLAVLAALLLERGRPVSRDRLIDLVWNDDPPTGGANTLQVHVSQLRKALAPVGTRITSNPAGYAIDLSGVEVDAFEFERLASLGRAALAGHDFTAAVRSLSEALAMWEGAALGELVGLPFAEAEAERLDRHRLAALEDRLQAQLGLGMHREVVAELETLVRDHPLREPLRGLLMLALYRCGRQADALDVYRTGRQLLVESQGVDPGSELRELHQAILNQAPSLSSSVETPRAAAAPPVPLTPLLGRESEVDAVTSLITDGAVRLVVLTGAGGVGKTRLALEVASAVELEFTDGVAWVDLAPVHEPLLVPAAIAAALNLGQVPDEDVLETVARRLAGRRALLVLDNFEHVLGSAATVSRLLGLAAGLRVLVTSRSPLGIVGEHDHIVPPLAVPPDSSTSTLSGLSTYPAAELFLSRARAVVGSLTVADADVTAVSAVCRGLDGLPLALELAAHSLKVLSLRELAEGLARALDALPPDTASLPARQRTLRATVDWSHGLLSPGAAMLLRRGAIFEGGWTLAAAEAIWSTEEGDVRAPLTTLIDLGLVTRTEGSEGVRFGMLETIRVYAAERLALAAEADLCASLHAAHFLELAESARLMERGPKFEERLRPVLAEAANLRAALSHLLAAGAGGELLRLGVSLAPLWQRQSNYDELRRWLTAGIRAEGGSGGRRVRARAFGFLSSEAMWRDDYAGADRNLELGVAEAQASDDLASLARARGMQAWTALMRGENDQAIRAAADAVAVARELGDPVVEARVLSDVALIAIEREDLLEADRLAHRALDQATASGDTDLWVSALGRIAYVALLRGELDEAERLAEECRQVGIRLGSRQAELEAESDLGYAALHRREFPRAAGHLCTALRGLYDLGDRWIAVQCIYGLSACASAIGDLSRAHLLAGAGSAFRTRSIKITTADERMLDALGLLVREPRPEDPLIEDWRRGGSLPLDRVVAIALAPSVLAG